MILSEARRSLAVLRQVRKDSKMGIKEQILNRKSQATKKLATVREMNVPTANADRLWFLLGEAESKVDEMLELYDDLIAEKVNEAGKRSAEDEKIKASEDYDIKIKQVTALLLSRTDPSQIRSRASISENIHATFKSSSDIKPTVLSAEAEPFEMRLWMDRFKAYFSAAHVNTLDIMGQRNVFLSFIDADLAVSIEGTISNISSITTCYEALEEHFLEIKPLFTRRLALFRMTKGKRRFKEFVADVRRMSREAELNSITASQLQVFIVLAGCRDDNNLFIKLRELKDPTMADLSSKAMLHEGALKDTTGMTVTAMKVETEESAEEILNLMASNCNGCGRPHTRDKCPFRDRPCFACGKAGHIKLLCRYRSPSRDDPSRNNQSPGDRGRTRERRRGSPGVRYNGENSRSPSVTTLNTVGMSTKASLANSNLTLITLLGRDQLNRRCSTTLHEHCMAMVT